MENAFIQACQSGDLEVVKTLGAPRWTRPARRLMHQVVDVQAINDGVQLASSNGHLEVVMYLVSQGADVSGNDTYALQWASENGHLEIVKYLVSQGANVRFNSDGALRYASFNGHLEVIKYLVSQGASITADNNWAVRLASNRGHLEVVKYLVSQGADVQAFISWAVQQASRNRHLELVKYLVSRGAPTTDISEKARHYLSFCKRIEEKRRIRAQKKIYFWWIPICYDITRPCGKRMA